MNGIECTLWNFKNYFLKLYFFSHSEVHISYQLCGTTVYVRALMTFPAVTLMPFLLMIIMLMLVINLILLLMNLEHSANSFILGPCHHLPRSTTTTPEQLPFLDPCVMWSRVCNAEKRAITKEPTCTTVKPSPKLSKCQIYLLNTRVQVCPTTQCWAGAASAFIIPWMTQASSRKRSDSQWQYKLSDFG